MELFLPGLVVLVIAALFAFLVIPRIGPTILVVMSILAIIAAGVHHYNMFSSEYALSTWQYGLAAYAPFVVMGLALVFVLAAISFFFSGPDTKAKVMNAVATPMETIQEGVSASAAAMPSAATATNPMTAAINTGLKNIGIAGAAAGAGAGFAAAANNSNGSNQNRRPNNQGSSNRRNNGGSPLIPGQGFSASQI